VRSVVAFVLLLLGALLVPVATAGWWLQETVVPADGYVDTVAPLATDPAVVTEVEKRLTEQTMNSVDRITGVPAAVRPVIRTGVRAVVARIVEDPSFADAWRASNRAAHRELVAALSGDSSVVSTGQGDAVELRLDTVSTRIKQELVAAGVPFAQAIPRVEASFPIGNTDDLARARLGYTVLDRFGRLPAVAAVLLIALGVACARRRGRALAWTAVVALLGLGVLAVGIAVGRLVYLGSLPSSVSSDAATAVFDTVTAGLRRDVLLVAIASLIALIGGVVLARVSPRR
jgi:hypothetical protein